MYKVIKRDCPMFGIGPYVCEFICDTASDITTLPTSISEGTGGRTAYDNQKCASGSIAIVVENDAESKRYILNNQDIWCPNKIGAGASASDSSICKIHYGTTEYWDSQPLLVGEKSHIYVYTDYAVTKNGEESVLVPNIKIGDGNAYLIDNPFVTTSVEELIDLHINDTTRHITEEERILWNNKVRCYLSSNDNETLVFTTE